MWAAWTSSASADATTVSSAPSSSSPNPSVAAALASAPAAYQFPQWRLLSTLWRQASKQWSRMTPQQTRLVVLAAAGGAAALVGTGLMSRVRYHRRRRNHEDENGDATRLAGGVGQPSSGHSAVLGNEQEKDEDIAFADPAESAFSAYVHRIRRQKEAPLLTAMEQLEAAVAAASSCAQDGDEEELSTEKWDDVRRRAVVADELLTQWICSLDGVPVRQRENLKLRRKEMVQRAAELHQRIEPYLPRKKEAETTVAQNSE